MEIETRDSTAADPLWPPVSVVSRWGILMLALIPPPLLVYGFGASWRWVGLGGLAWSAALLLKIPLARIAHSCLFSRAKTLNAAVSGAVSSMSELGVAAFVFSLSPPESSILANVLAFGAAAGCVEILFVLGAMAFDQPSAEKVAGWIEGAKASFCVRHVQPIERATALAGHVGSRGLVSLALYSGSYELAAIALLGFALTDGVAAYGSLKDWDWFDPVTCRRFHGFCAGVSTAEVTLFALSSMSLL